MTRAQLETLREAKRMPRLGFDGVLAKGQRHRSIAALKAAGLLRFAGYGIECDGDGFTVEPEREWPIYEITDKGRAFLAGGDHAKETR